MLAAWRAPGGFHCPGYASMGSTCKTAAGCSAIIGIYTLAGAAATRRGVVTAAGHQLLNQLQIFQARPSWPLCPAHFLFGLWQWPVAANVRHDAEATIYS
eukprot:SM000008S22255  [mRNA]  locus=s8:666600:667035:- [translate_table: standard]